MFITLGHGRSVTVQMLKHTECTLGDAKFSVIIRIWLLPAAALPDWRKSTVLLDVCQD